MLQPFVYAAPTRITFGPGAVVKVAEELRAMGCGKPILVTDQGVSPLRFFDGLKDSMRAGRLRYEVFDGVPRDPALKDADALVDLIKERNCDSVVAIGGRR